jgi:general secretion pathway protein K
VIERHACGDRRGFVMLTTLWIITSAAVIAMGAALVARHGVVEGSARVWLRRARWTALGCERRALAAVDLVLRDAPTDEDAASTWRMLARRAGGSSLLAGCEVQFEAAGTRLDVNAATGEMLAGLFDALGLGDESPALVDALQDWIDPDDEPRANGAERAWYEAAGRFPPRNGSLADARELRRVRGFDQLRGLDTVLATTAGRVSLATASVPVLVTVPGITRETADQIFALQQAGTPLRDLVDVAPLVSRRSAALLEARYADALRASTPNPDAWLVRVRAANGTPAVSVQLEWRLVRSGRRAVVAETRSRL